MILIFVTLFTSVAFAQAVTNQSSNNLSITDGKIKNSTNVTVIDLVGDLDCGNNLDVQIKKDNPDLFVAMGDLCYKSNLRNFSATYDDLKKDDRLACLIGNHDSEEDGNLIILNQTREYCGDHWYRKIGNDTTLLIGLNTNGDTKLQTQWAQSLVTNATLMKDIKNVILLTHKPAYTPPESHHPATKTTIDMISGIEGNISKSIQIYKIAGHNHFMAESKDGSWFISGAGGRSHYNGTSDADWPFVNTEEDGYLQMRINNTDGRVISTNFYGLDGKLIH